MLLLSFNEAITIRLWRLVYIEDYHGYEVYLQRSHNHSVMETVNAGNAKGATQLPSTKP